jgi:ABC-2 type transport system permease protein
MWPTLFALGFRRHAAYRAAAFGGAFTNCIFGLIRAAVVLAVIGTAGGTLGGYDTAAAATYVWLGQALIGPIHLGAWSELAQRVRTGDVAVDLARPVDPTLAYLAADLGRAAFLLLPRGVPPLVIGALTTGLAVAATPGPYALGLLSVALAVAVSFTCRWLVNLSAFWLLDLRGPMTLYVTAADVLSGLVVPVRWFPEWLRTFAAATPFPSMLQTPVDVLLGRAGWPEIGIQALWLAGLLAAGRIVFAVGTRKLVIQGG